MRQGEEDPADSESRNAKKKSRSRVFQPAMDEEDRYQYRTGCRRRAEYSESLRPDVQNLGRKYREQGRSAAKQHREQIENLRAEQLWLCQEKTDPECKILANAIVI